MKRMERATALRQMLLSARTDRLVQDLQDTLNAMPPILGTPIRPWEPGDAGPL